MKEDADRLSAQHALAGAYRANGRVKEAVELLEHVVAVQKEALAEDHPSQLASQHELARIYWANGQFETAVQLLEHDVLVKRIKIHEGQPSRQVSEVSEGRSEVSILEIALNLLSIYYVQDKAPDTAVLWVHASSAARFDQDLRNLACNLYLRQR